MSTRRDKDSSSAETFANRNGPGDPLLAWMREQGIPLTVDNYLDLNYPDRAIEDLSAEERLGVPEGLDRSVNPATTRSEPSGA